MPWGSARLCARVWEGDGATNVMTYPPQHLNNIR